MAEGLLTLLVYCALMAIASFAAGMLPLAITLSQSQLRLISAIGMGVLVGTSMIVIIPEGIETIYSAPASSSAAARQPEMHGRSLVDWAAIQQRDSTILSRGDQGIEYLWERGDESLSHPQAPPPSAPEEHSHEDEDEHHHDEEGGSPHKWVGFSLIAGFVLMYLIDVVPTHARPAADSQPYHIAIDNLRGSMSSPIDSPASHLTKPSAMTLGLVIHAAADGIALGASSASQNLALGAIIFLAIMLHKAPAAFGLTAVLLRGGLGKRQVRMHLMVFSLAAPAGALVTWLIIGILGGGASGGAGMQWWTGVLLLFSGGTFLYVAMHTMQDQTAQLHETGQKSSLTDILASVFGMMLPLATQIGHHHH